MSLRGLLLMCFVGALFMCACGNQPTTTTNNETKSSPAATPTPDAFAETRAIYAKECQNCHGADGTGGKVKLEDGKTLKVPTFRAGHALRHSDQDFRHQIIEGGDGMPSFKVKLSGKQMDELIRFIRQEFQPGHTPPAEKAERRKYNPPFTIYN